LNGKIIDVPPAVEEDVYGRLVRDRMSGKIPESIIQVTLIKRYGVDRTALLRALARMVDEGIVIKNKRHGRTFLPTINTEVSLRSSYHLRRTIEPSGILLESFRIDPAALERSCAAHLTVLPRAEAVSSLNLFEIDRASLAGQSRASATIPQRGHLIMAISPSAFGDAEIYRHRMRNYIAELKNGRKAPGISEILDSSLANAACANADAL
jgi:hypothetical protein